jgi:hypothetical protein
MNNRIRILFATLFTTGLLLASFPAHAQESEPAAADETAETQGISQGDFAVKFATKIGLWAGISRPLTPSKAISLLTEIGVSPFGGWDAEKLMTPGDLARMIVQALDELDEIEEAEQDNPETTAYIDFLKRRYDLDIPVVDVSAADVVGKGPTTPSSEFRDNASSNPVENRGEEGELDELTAGGLSSGTPNLLTAAEVDRILQDVTPSQGGGNRVDTDAVNTTPSAPTP